MLIFSSWYTSVKKKYNFAHRSFTYQVSQLIILITLLQYTWNIMEFFMWKNINPCQIKWMRQIFLHNYWYDPCEYLSQKSPHWFTLFGLDQIMKLFNVFFTNQGQAKRVWDVIFGMDTHMGHMSILEHTYPCHFTLGMWIIKWNL